VKHEDNEESYRNRWFGEPINNESGDKCKAKTRPKCINPRTEWTITPGPFGCEPTTHDLEWEVNEHHKSKVFTFEPLFNQLQTGGCIIRSEPNFGE